MSPITMSCWRALPPLLLLGACTAQNCDPANAGFISGVGCEVSGSYNQREQTQRQTLDAAHQELARQRAIAAASARDRAAAEADLASMQAKLSDMEQQDADLQRRLAAAQRRQGADQAEVKRLQARLAALEAARTHAAAAPDPAEVAKLEERRRALLDSITSSGL